MVLQTHRTSSYFKSYSSGFQSYGIFGIGFFVVVMTLIVFPVLFCHIPGQKQFGNFRGKKIARAGRERKREGKEGKKEERKERRKGKMNKVSQVFSGRDKSCGRHSKNKVELRTLRKEGKTPRV